MSQGPQPSGPIEELAVAYDPGPTYDRIQRYKKMLRSRIISLVISVVVLVILTVWQRDRLSLAAGIVTWAIVLGVALAWIGVTWWLYRRSLTAVATLGEGIGLRVGRPGIELAGQRVGWAQVQSIAAAKGRVTLGPLLQLQQSDGSTVAVPWDQLDVRPATLDSTVRAYSGGRHGVDLNALDA